MPSIGGSYAFFEIAGRMTLRDGRGTTTAEGTRFAWTE